MIVLNNILNHRKAIIGRGRLLSVIPMLMAFLLVSCNGFIFEDGVEEPLQTHEKYYVNLTIKVPTTAGTRSSTETGGDSSEGWLDGTEDESTLNSLTIYLVADNEVKTTFPVSDPEEVLNGVYLVTAEVDLNDFTSLQGNTISLYVVGNEESSGLTHDFNNSVKNPMNSKFGFSNVIDFGNDGKGKEMLFVNAEPFTSIIPTDVSPFERIKALFTNSTAKNTYYMGELDLERAVARIEYKDAKPTGKSNVFKIGESSITLKLETMWPFNVNNDCYLFRQTSEGDATAYNPSSLELLGNENGGANGKYNWVASPWWKNQPQLPGSFINGITVGTEDYSFTTTGGSINLDALLSRTPTTGEYHPWCYISENTVPSIAMMAETDNTGADLVTKYATGIAFKFLLVDANGNALTWGGTSQYPPGVSHSTNSKEAYEGEYLTVTYGDKYVDVKPEGGKYYLTYIGCIVHNNGDKGENDFAPMYYGVVRNNTYQVSINSISGLPIPQDKKSYFITLKINVMPWQLRKNDFEF